MSIFALSFDANARKIRAKKMKKLVKDVERMSVDNRDYFNQAFPRKDEIKYEERKSGSLWVDSYSSRLYNDLHKASRVGDMVTIMIEENASGRKIAETRTERDSSQNFGISGLFGLIQKITGTITGMDPENMIDANHSSSHDGRGETTREGSLIATVTARVVRILKNGDMQIRGQKNIRVNGEEQLIILEGFVRPYDIAPNNTVNSNYIADARITFNGFGVVADKQKPGWLTRILDKVLPF